MARRGFLPRAHEHDPSGRGGQRLPNRAQQVRAAAQTPNLTEEWRRQNRYDRRARLVGHEPLTMTGTVRLTFEPVDGQPLTFAPGQFIGITDGQGRARRRRSPYCLASDPRDDGRFELLVRVVPEGPMSQVLAELAPGDEIEFRGPLGRAMQPKQADTDVVLLATGVGIGPLLPVARQLLEETPHRSVTLYWGLRLRDDICLVSELDDLAARSGGSFSYAITLSQPDRDWHGLCGRITESVPGLLSTIRDKSYVLVGNGAMITEMAEALTALGVEETHLHREHYFNGRHQPHPDTVKEIRRRFVATDARPAPFVLA